MLNMVLTKKDLFYKIYNELVDVGIIDEYNSNFDDEYYQKREFVRTLEDVLQDYYILDQLHEIKDKQ